MTAQYDDRNMSALARADSMEDQLRSSTPDRGNYGHSPSVLRQTVLVSILLLGLLFASIDASIVSTSLVSIAMDLGGFSNVPWVALSYLLSYLGFAIAFAKMSDIYGRRALLSASWLLFAGFSLGCGLAQNMSQLIACRVFQGIGGSGLYSLAQIGLFEVGPSHKPSLLGALVGMTLAVSFVLGPILGGTISHLASWRWIFFINIPCGAVALLGLVFAWPHRPVPRLQPLEAIKRIDLVGNITIMVASTLLVFSLQQVGSFDLSWRSPVIIVTLTVALLCWVVFLTWELFIGLKRHTQVQAVLPLRLVTTRPYIAAVICTLFTGFSYLAIIIILPERFQIVNNDNALMAGLHLLPMLGSCAFGSFMAGAASAKKNNTAITLIVASCLQLVGVGLLTTLADVTTNIQPQYGYQAIFGLGVGLSFGAATILTSVQSHPTDLAVAQGAIAQARVLGGAIGIAACSIVFNSEVDAQLQDRMSAADLATLRQSPTINDMLQPALQGLIREVYAGAFTANIRVMICMSAVALVASLFTFEIRPPPMPSANQNTESTVAPLGAHSEAEAELFTFENRRPPKNKEFPITPLGAQSETELEDATSHRSSRL